MQVSHSRIDQFKRCPYKYKLQYLDKLKTLPTDQANHPFKIGTALHTGIEKGIDEAIKEYYNEFFIITDRHIEEVMKLESLIPKAKKLLPDGEHEIKIEDEHFIGFVDLLAPTTVFKREVEVPNQYDLYDFKYSNNVDNYMDSKQLHLYKYFFEKNNPGKYIKNLYYLFVPKTSIRQKKTEDLLQFRLRLKGEISKLEPKLVQIEYQPEKVIEFMIDVKELLEADDYPKQMDYLCNYCEYQKYCIEGEDYMLLPKNERRNIERIEKKVIWMYGAPFTGKTTFANKFPDPLMLNTDGNIKFVDAPFIPIKDDVTVTGRLTKRTLAWDKFKGVIAELEKKENTFKTIIVDLLEDTYEHCRLYMYDDMGITHESDDSFRAWDKVTTEFLSTLKKLMNLDYENIIIISHEDKSRDITKKSGENITSIKPNLRDKVANKVAGMVDIVARVVADGDKRTLSFKTDEVIFGGGRLKASTNEIALDYDEFLKIYEEANRNAVAALTGRQAPIEEPEEEIEDKPVEELPEDLTSLTVKELRDIAKKLDIDITGLRKQELIDAIESTEEKIEEPTDDIEEPETEQEDEDEEQEDEEPRRTRRTRRKRGE